jgi:hypothetical protein
MPSINSNGNGSKRLRAQRKMVWCTQWDFSVFLHILLFVHTKWVGCNPPPAKLLLRITRSVL